MSWLMSIASDIHVTFDGNVDVAMGELGNMLLGIVVLGVVKIGIDDLGAVNCGVLVNEFALEDISITVEHGVNVLVGGGAVVAVIVIDVVGIVFVNIIDIVVVDIVGVVYVGIVTIVIAVGVIIGQESEKPLGLLV